MPGLGPGAARFTRRPASGTGSARSRIWLNSENIAAFAPMPSASETIATIVTNGVLKRVRKANFRLGISSRRFSFAAMEQARGNGIDGPARGMVYRLPVMELTIRPAAQRDVPLILDLIRGLAEYERLAHEVTATEATLRESLFGRKPSAE